MVETAIGVLLGGLGLGLIAGHIALWVKVRARELSTHQVVPIQTNAFADLQKEIDSITGAKTEDLYQDLDPRNLENFERFSTEDDKHV